MSWIFDRTAILSHRIILKIQINFFSLLDELDNMNSTERISFLQEKLQEIRKYYMSLKSEVATIDRRRKRLKKKDREGNLIIIFLSSVFQIYPVIFRRFRFVTEYSTHLLILIFRFLVVSLLLLK